MPMRPKRSVDPVKAAHELYLEIIGEAPQQPMPENTPAAVAVRRGAAEGGQKRAAKLTSERRREIAKKAAAKRWEDRPRQK
jgi:hypothetical protein